MVFEFSDSANLTIAAAQDIRIAGTPPLSEQKVLVEGVVGLRAILQMIFDTWRQGGDFQIVFNAPDGTCGPTVTFQKPAGHRDWAAEFLEVHRSKGEGVTCSVNDHAYSIQHTDTGELLRFCQKCGTSAILTNDTDEGVMKLVWKPITDSKLS